MKVVKAVRVLRIARAVTRWVLVRVVVEVAVVVAINEDTSRSWLTHLPKHSPAKAKSTSLPGSKGRATCRQLHLHLQPVPSQSRSDLLMHQDKEQTVANTLL